MRIATISDLHIGDKARRYDFRPEAPVETGVTPYLEEFATFVEEQSIIADYLLVPGDIANYGAPIEYELAAQRILQIASLLQVDSKNIVIVPGNHDVCWGIQQLGGDFWRTKKFTPISEILVPALGLSRGLYDSLFEPPYAAVQALGSLNIVMINSAFGDDFDNTPHHGALAPSTVEFLTASIPSISRHQPDPSLLAVHHHILPMLDPDPYWRDFSIMNNSEALISFLQSAHIDFVVHGHKHWPRIWRHRDHPNPLFVVFCAGSFSAEIHESISSKVYNKFHLFEFSGRDPHGNLAGNAFSWSYHGGHGWQPSERVNGIDHREPFGYYREQPEILDELRAAYLAAGGGTGALEVSLILEQVSHVQFLSDAAIYKALRLLATEKGATILNDPATGKDFLFHG